MKILTLPVAAALLCACGGHPVQQVNPLHSLHNMMSHHLLTVNMGSEHHSDQWGSASMSDHKHGVIVTIDLHGVAPHAREMAYLAKQGCAAHRPAPWRALHPVVRGKSKSFVPHMGVGVLRGGTHSVVVDDARGMAEACGDLRP